MIKSIWLKLWCFIIGRKHIEGYILESINIDLPKVRNPYNYKRWNVREKR